MLPFLHHLLGASLPLWPYIPYMHLLDDMAMYIILLIK